jgi:anti-sigma B factor antagonist
MTLISCIVGAMFEVETSSPGDHIVRLNLDGELDLLTAPKLQAAIDQATSNGYRCMEIDLAKLTFIDSTGLHLLVEAHKRMKAKQAQTVVVNTPRNVAKVFEVMGLDRVFAPVAHA